uniref:Uncharacterized protein n=1 Tax=Romanomermis culicivorax TaxID=13658 RepID=A0A915HRY7_ROMCU
MKNDKRAKVMKSTENSSVTCSIFEKSNNSSFNNIPDETTYPPSPEACGSTTIKQIIALMAASTALPFFFKIPTPTSEQVPDKLETAPRGTDKVRRKRWNRYSAKDIW